ncbi:9126_t:CDS:2 [Ambispora leptoticha]|uniref:9126_t:CDS:1 n=1 Tax=Ambispora leptoticha TaxID=144679 RepID=A0A9N9FRV9_9GLOM|nr:9126_t:CDS:2 [Ambispora leptoticha]
MSDALFPIFDISTFFDFAQIEDPHCVELTTATGGAATTPSSQSMSILLSNSSSNNTTKPESCTTNSSIVTDKPDTNLGLKATEELALTLTLAATDATADKAIASTFLGCSENDYYSGMIFANEFFPSEDIIYATPFFTTSANDSGDDTSTSLDNDINNNNLASNSFTSTTKTSLNNITSSVSTFLDNTLDTTAISTTPIQSSPCSTPKAKTPQKTHAGLSSLPFYEQENMSTITRKRPLVEYDRQTKPPYSYAALIGQAILQSPSRKMTLNEIYTWITENYPYYQREEKSGSGWENSIRHNLSLNKAFKRLPRTEGQPGKGCYWTILPEQESTIKNSSFKERRSSKKFKASPAKSNTTVKVENNNGVVDSNSSIVPHSQLKEEVYPIPVVSFGQSGDVLIQMAAEAMVEMQNHDIKVEMIDFTKADENEVAHSAIGVKTEHVTTPRTKKQASDLNESKKDDVDEGYVDTEIQAESKATKTTKNTPATLEHILKSSLKEFVSPVEVLLQPLVPACDLRKVN